MSAKVLNKLLVIALFFGMFGVCLFWMTCTKKNPVDPTKSALEDINIISNISASPTRILVGSEQSIIRARLINEDGDPVVNQAVTFTTTLGTVNPAVVLTDNAGWVQTIFSSAQDMGSSTVKALSENSVSASVIIDVISQLENQMRISSARTTLLANGIDTTTVSVTMFSDSAQPVIGATVIFTTSVGTITPSGITGDNGNVKAVLTSISNERDSIAVINAVSDSLSAGLSIPMRGIQFSISADPTAIVADGSSISNITVVVKEATSKIAIPYAEITFSADPGLIPNTATTDEQGVAQVSLTSSGSPDTSQVTARYGNLLTQTTEVAFVSQSASQFTFSELTTSDNNILGNGLEQAVITTKVININGAPVAGDSIEFRSSAGKFASQWVTTNANGIASSTLTPVASSEDSTALVTVYRGGGVQSRQLSVIFIGIDFQISANPLSILADGQSVSTITVVLKETTSKISIPNAEVYFSADPGLIPNKAKTDQLGVVQVSLTSADSPATSDVTALYGNELTQTLQVAFVNQSATQGTLKEIKTTSNRLLANGLEQAVITVQVVDINNDPVAGDSIEFRSTAGRFTLQWVVTNNNGYASTVLTPLAAATDSSAQVTAFRGGGLQSLQTYISFIGIDFELNAIPQTIIADGNSTSTIQVVLKETTTQVAISGGVITLATDEGTIPNIVVTNNSGVAAGLLTSSSTPVTAHVIASYGATISDTADVVFQGSDPTYLQVSVSPPVLPADGQSYAQIRANVSDATHNPVPNGTSVEFNLIDGSGFVEQFVTTESGIAVSSLRSGTLPDTAFVRVSIGSLEDTVSVVYTVGEPNQVLISADRDSLDADGIDNASIEARILDAQGNPIEGATVEFSATIGDVTPSAQTNSLGYAYAQFSSGVVGITAISASVGVQGVSATTYIVLVPGEANSMILNFDPTAIGVQGTGQNQTSVIEADVRDAKNNPVLDGTLITFSIIHGPGGGEDLTSTGPIPTVAGKARVSIFSGTISGVVRVQASTLTSTGVIIAEASEILIHAGPPYMEDGTRYESTHMTLTAEVLNIWRHIGSTTLTIAVFDKYHNPCQEGTAVHLTTAGGGVSTHTAYTDDNGLANVTLYGANPQPLIYMFYNSELMQDPNPPYSILPGPMYYADLDEYLIPNFEGDSTNGINFPYYPGLLNEVNPEFGFEINSMQDSIAACPRYNNADGLYVGLENDGVTRVMARTEGRDLNGDSLLVWDQIAVVYSGAVGCIENSATELQGVTLHLGESAIVTFVLSDDNGNPIESATGLEMSLTADVDAKLSWTGRTTTAGWGTIYYQVTISNNIDPTSTDPKIGPTAIEFTWSNDHQFGSKVTNFVVNIDL